ncbi:NAD(P)-binding protein [Aspergillus eucalypticola CBS 122712]|uniref:NAD(P)-binding protein n=1 Tax=Aspergillus eucalypticola (strain CBS 122712 / IBT 29274) TaxID=1448314 RepID=A0A317URP7_ASPEC|nr:NAD(P)-binding protein [Aspergillus eucalypticola CBS 122712]PWY64331.1 NAD(P)-binding protein [Aspergillus eucalypticola CBS 122712]
MSYQLVIFDFDGTLFDTYDAIEHSIQLTFQRLLPSHPPPSSSDIRPLVSTGAPPGDTFRSLHPNPTTFDESLWIPTYRELYAIHGQSRTSPYPAARDVLQALHDRNQPMAIISNKAAVAVKAALEKTDLLHFFPDSLILGHGVAGVQRKPDPSSFTDVLWPNWKALGAPEEVEAERVLMVGDTLTDILYARNIGAQVCWCRDIRGCAQDRGGQIVTSEKPCGLSLMTLDYDTDIDSHRPIARGLGSSIGKKLRNQGARLAILYAPFEAARRDELLEAGYGELPAREDIRTYECDITNPEAVKSVFTTLKEETFTPSSTMQSAHAFPSILVNTAGYVSLSDLELTPPEETLKHLHTNVLGPMLCSQAFARLYLAAAEVAHASPNPPPPGRIVNLASQAAHVALHRHGAYCASKAALLGLTRSMASEWGGRGITANSVSPTVAWTALGQKAWGQDDVREAFLKTIPTGKFAQPDEVADAVLFLCQDSSGMINGADIRVDGGFTIR